MATVMGTTDSVPVEPLHETPGSPGSLKQRRKREELEALAADFVNSTIHVRKAQRKLPLPALAGGAAVLGVLLAWLLWPEPEPVVAETRAPAQAAADAKMWAQRLEAERARRRKELGSPEYMAKLAAADSALLAEMSARAKALTTVPESPAEPSASAPKVAAGEPTPRGNAAARAAAPAEAPPPAQIAAASAPPAESPRAESREAAGPAAPAAAPAKDAAPAAAPPQQVAAAPSGQCRLHVSELSESGTLTYAEVRQMKGARIDDRGHVYTPKVKLDDGRRVVFEVMPNGCVNWRRA